MNREVARSTAWGLLFAAVLATLIIAGSRNLRHFDAALVGYTFAVLFSTFGITYRYAMWLQRPPTALYWRRGWQVFFSRKHWARNVATWFKRVAGDVALNRFIFRRSLLRGLTHMLIMWGCIIAVLVTFPLVFGWVHFETVPGHIEVYRSYFFGYPSATFAVQSLQAYIIFHALVWSAFLVIMGVMLAMRRRMVDRGAAAVQNFSEDFLPLILLFAISITGLLLTVSYTWLKGYAYSFLAILHAVTVIFTLLFLSFGKFFHVFQRPAQLGVSFYKDVGESEEMAHCRRCGHAFTSRMHLEDLLQVERQLGFRYELAGSPVEHYQFVCPPCRRALVALSQGAAANAHRPEIVFAAEPLPVHVTTGRYANSGLYQGPLGEEDATNFHA